MSFTHRMSFQRSLRHREPNEGNILPNLGKSLTHHQVLPAVMALRVANEARTDFGKAILSGTGGNPRAVNQAVQGRGHVSGVRQISHFDARQVMKGGLAQSLKHAAHVKSLISN